jgi:protease IV
MAEADWEREVIEKLASAALKEQRRARRWGIFFKLLFFGYLAIALLLLVDWRGAEGLGAGKHSALVDVVGVIDAKGDASADRVTEALQNAFKNKNTQGVILRINSPGGSPVQAGIIYDEIRRLRGIYPNIPMYAVVEDICASGGYYIAAATDRIYVDKASIIGSIGVIMDGDSRGPWRNSGWSGAFWCLARTRLFSTRSPPSTRSRSATPSRCWTTYTSSSSRS